MVVFANERDIFYSLCGGGSALSVRQLVTCLTEICTVAHSCWCCDESGVTFSAVARTDMFSASYLFSRPQR